MIQYNITAHEALNRDNLSKKCFNTRPSILLYARLKLKKNQAVAKQHPETELLLFVNNSHSSFKLSSKNYKTYSKKCTKNNGVCLMRLYD